MPAAQPGQHIASSKTLTIALVGNPNTGKSTLFNVLTGHRQRVGNYPGVTVEKKTGTVRGIGGYETVEVIDLPGAYSLSPTSEDEAIVLDVLLGKQAGTPLPDVILVVLDATNLTRNLFLLSQLLELDRPVVVALNMMDLAAAQGISIDVPALAAELGVPVIPVVAPKGTGIDELKAALGRSAALKSSGQCAAFPECVCAELDGLCHAVTPEATEKAAGKNDGAVVRLELLQSLLDPGGFHEQRLVARCGKRFAEELARRRDRIRESGESLVEVEARIRYAWIERVVRRVVSRTVQQPSRTAAADRVLTHPVGGLFFLLVLMGLCFQAIYTWAGPLMDAIDGLFVATGSWIGNLIPEGALQSLVVDGAVAGVGAVLVFLPQIVILFLFIAILEDCGYMARAAFLFDRWMSLIGLSGKSFIPLLSSFACAVPGILATRTIENRRDRFITILVAPLMSCSARLPVYTLLIAAFIPATPIFGGWFGLQALTMLIMYVLGVIVAIPVAVILQKTVFRGEGHAFLMELPTYKWPTARTVFFRVYEQAKEFTVTAGTMIFAVTVIVWALGYYPRPASVARQFDVARAEARALFAETEDSSGVPRAESTELLEALSEIDRREAGEYLRQSFLGRMGRFVEPIVKPLGWDWRIGTAAIASFPAREVVIATMGTIYNLGSDEDESSTALRDRLKAATWPDGTPVFTVATALSLMVFFALCCQCAATLAVIKRETQSWRWPAFTFAYMTVLAYVAALITYQAASRLGA